MHRYSVNPLYHACLRHDTAHYKHSVKQDLVSIQGLVFCFKLTETVKAQERTPAL